MKESVSQTIFEKGRAGYPAIYLLSSEDVLSQHQVKEASGKLGRTLYFWDLHEGLVKHNVENNKRADKAISDSTDPAAALEAIDKLPEKTVVMLRLFHHFLDNPLVQVKLLDTIALAKKVQKMIIIWSPILKLPREVEKEIALVDAALPSREEMTKVMDGLLQTFKQERHPTPEIKTQLVEAAMGMTSSEAESAFALAVLRPKLRNNEERWDVPTVMSEKCKALEKDGLLQYYPPDGVGMQDIGGMIGIKAWANLRRKAFTQAARDFGLPVPKGLLVVGVPGTGKSLLAKGMSAQLHLPLLRCDTGRIYAGLVGASEENVRRVIHTAEAVSPCVLWFDEIEKGFAGSKSSGNTDSGVGARVFGTILTWMQEKTAPVFVFATANNIHGLPPEFLRKGRFDEIFSVTLPTKEERKEIFRIHLAKVRRPTAIDDGQLNDLVERTDGWSGAEIEGAVVEGLYAAFTMEQDLKFVHLVNAVDDVIPLSQSMSEEIRKMEEWCKGRTRPANATIAYDPVGEIRSLGGRIVEA